MKTRSAPRRACSAINRRDELADFRRSRFSAKIEAQLTRGAVDAEAEIEELRALTGDAVEPAALFFGKVEDY